MTADLMASVDSLAHDFGIGPWKIWRCTPPRLFDRMLDGGPASFSMRLAVAWVGATQLEVIQPLEGDSLYRRYLARRNGMAGAQHVLVTGSSSFRKKATRLAAAGFPVVQSARLAVPARVGGVTIPAPLPVLPGAMATRFFYSETESSLGTILEIARLPLHLGWRRAWEIAQADEVIAPGRASLIHSLHTVILGARDPQQLAADWAHRAGTPIWRRVGDAWRCDLRGTSLEAREHRVTETVALGVHVVDPDLPETRRAFGNTALEPRR